MLSPQEKASELLTAVGGVQREAEVLAWKARDEQHPESDGFKFLSQVAVAIALGQEYPPVERKEASYSTPAPKDWVAPAQ